jgi:hypothetical protein
MNNVKDFNDAVVDANDAMLNNTADEQKTVRFANIKRILATLDKFLDKKIASIAILYFFSVIACGFGLIVSGKVASAASDGARRAGATTSNSWLWAVLAVFTFLFLLGAVRVAALRFGRRNKVK